jgi:hypothetical protein
MDEIVLRGMAKWPNVPSVYGWLCLDGRGHWLIKGDQITNPGVIAFIGRNYAHDEQGRWFFQNGPQRVFVSLEHAPFVYRVVNAGHAALEFEAHVGKPVTSVSGAWIDEYGVVLLETEHGIGTVHDGDLDRLLPSFVDAKGFPLHEAALEKLLERIEGGQSVALWLAFRRRDIRVEPIRSSTVPERFGFIAHPVQPDGEQECC